MAEDQSQQQGNDSGYVVMTPEDVVLLSKKAAEEAVNRYRSQADNGDGENLIGLDGKFVKQLQNTVGVFNALKDFSSSPLQKVVEEKVGQFAAGMVENAFSGPRSTEKKSIIETILNSQFAYGLGASLGNKSPELIEAMSRNLGREQTQHIIDNVITKGTQGPGQASGGQGSQQDNVELLLSLDANNPEHIAAYSESQGGLPPDVARKMLMIHQDAIIKRFGDQGAVVKKAGSEQRTQSPPASTRPQSRTSPVEQAPKNVSEEPMQYSNYDEFPSDSATPKSDVIQPNVQEQSPGTNSNDEMLDVMKKFSNDIGQAMSAMIEEISTLKGTVTQLKGEIDTIRSNRPIPPGVRVSTFEQPPIAPPVAQPYVAPPPVSTQVKREYIPPVAPSPVVQSVPIPPRVVTHQPKVEPIVNMHGTRLGEQENGLIEQDIHAGRVAQEIVIEPVEQGSVEQESVEQEPEKSLEEFVGIREHNMTAEELANIKPKEVVQRSTRSGISKDTGPDVKWTDEDIAKDLAIRKRAKESNKPVSKPKDITEELIKVAEEDNVRSDIEATQKIEDTQKIEETTKPEEVVNIEEKRPIVPIKRSEIRKKIRPLIKKTENGVI